jgi:hypothetical protein
MHGWGLGTGRKWFVGWPRGKEKGKWVGPKETVQFSNYLKNLKMARIDSIKRWPSILGQFSNKIYICRELNKEQLSLFELFQIRDII